MRQLLAIKWRTLPFQQSAARARRAPESCFEADFAADASASTPPAYIAVVDGSASEEVLELVRAGLHAALKALPNGALFGLISCTDTMTLHLLGGLHTQPHARHIPLPPSGKGEPLALLDAVSIDKLLTRIDDAGRERAAAAIESLRGAVQEEGVTLHLHAAALARACALSPMH